MTQPTTQPTTQQILAMAESIANKPYALENGATLHQIKDEQNRDIYWRVRVDKKAIKKDGKHEKFFIPFHWTGTAFEAKEPPAPPEGKPLYGLERLKRKPAALVIVCEGERKTDALNKMIGRDNPTVLVVSVCGGAQAVATANWQPLAGRACFVFPDNDEAGAGYAADVLEALQGIASSAAVLDISGLGLPPKGDAVEWLAAGGNIDGLMLLIDATRSPKSAPDGERIATDETAQGQDLAAFADHASEVVLACPAIDDAPEAAQVEAVEVLEAIETEAETVARCAALNPLAYDRIKKATAELLGVSTSALDKAVRLAQKDLSDDDAPFFELVEPHPHPIDPAALLTEISDTVKRFIVCPDETADAAAVWIAFTWFIDVVEVAPIAVITAPEKRCGKSMLLFLIGRLSRDALTASNISPAALYRSIELWQPTLLIDEADAFMRDNEELRGLLNCGHTRESAFTIRCVGDDSTPARFNLWGAKAIAGIGTLADTLMDRAVCLELRRKTPEEVRERLRHAPAGLFEGISSKLARFSDDYREAVRTSRPNLPQALNDRAQDNWSSLLAVASCAGDAWLERATAAALKLSGEKAGDTQSVGNELLADIQTILETKQLDKISTAELITALCEDEELSWATYNRGKPLSPKQLSNRLKNYGITSHQYRPSKYENPVRGFDAKDFDDVFSRYLSNPEILPLHVTKTLEANKDGLFCVTGENSVTLQNVLSVTNNNDGLPAKNEFVTDTSVTKPRHVTQKPTTYGLCNTVTAVTDKNEGAKKEEKGNFSENWGAEL